MSKPMSGNFESALAYIHGNNESVALVDDILAQLSSMALTHETIPVRMVQELVSNAFLKHTGTGQAMQRVLDAANDRS